MAEWIHSTLERIHSQLPDKFHQSLKKERPGSKTFEQITTNAESGRLGSTAFAASNRGSINCSIKHKKWERQREQERCKEFDWMQEEERQEKVHRELDVVWQREWKKLQKAVRQEKRRRKREAELQALKHEVLQEWAKTTTLTLTLGPQTDEEIGELQRLQKLEGCIHLNTGTERQGERQGEQETISEAWTSPERQDVRGEEERQRWREISSHLKQNRQHMREIVQNTSKPMTEEDKRMELISRQRLADMEAGGVMTTGLLNNWETAGSREISRDWLSSPKMEGRGGINIEADGMTQMEIEEIWRCEERMREMERERVNIRCEGRMREIERETDNIRCEGRIREFERQRDTLRNEKKTAEIERLAEIKRRQMVTKRELERLRMVMEENLKKAQKIHEERLRELERTFQQWKGTLQERRDSSQKVQQVTSDEQQQHSSVMNTEREMDEEQVRRCGQLDAWLEDADGECDREREVGEESSEGGRSESRGHSEEEGEEKLEEEAEKLQSETQQTGCKRQREEKVDKHKRRAEQRREEKVESRLTEVERKPGERRLLNMVRHAQLDKTVHSLPGMAIVVPVQTEMPSQGHGRLHDDDINVSRSEGPGTEKATNKDTNVAKRTITTTRQMEKDNIETSIPLRKKELMDDELVEKVQKTTEERWDVNEEKRQEMEKQAENTERFRQWESMRENIDSQTCRMWNHHQADLEGTPVSSGLLVQPTVTRYGTDETHAIQRDKTKAEVEAGKPRTDQHSRTPEWESTSCIDEVTQTWKQSLSKNNIVQGENVWGGRMKEQQELESDMDVKCMKKQIEDEEASQRTQEILLRDLDTQRECKSLRELERKSDKTVKEKKHIESVPQESQGQLQEENEERAREKQVEKERLEMKEEKKQLQKNEMEIEKEIEKPKRQQKGEQEEKEKLESEDLQASRGHWETGRETLSVMLRQSDGEKHGPKAAAKAQVQKDAKLSEVRQRSELHNTDAKEAIKHLAQRKGPRTLYQPTVQPTSTTKPRARPKCGRTHIQSNNQSSNPTPDTVKVLSVTEVTPYTDCLKLNCQVVDCKAEKNNPENTVELSQGDGNESNICQSIDKDIENRGVDSPSEKLMEFNAYFQTYNGAEHIATEHPGQWEQLCWHSDSELEGETGDEHQVSTEEQVLGGSESLSQAHSLASDMSDEEEEKIGRISPTTPSADEAAREEMPGVTEPADVGLEGGTAKRDKSVRRRFLGWVNGKAKNYYQSKILKTFAREMEEGDQPYQSWYMTSAISRAEREKQKRWALLKGEARRQQLEESWLKMEAKKAEKKRKKKEEFKEIDETLWFCEDIASKGFTREQLRNLNSDQEDL